MYNAMTSEHAMHGSRVCALQLYFAQLFQSQTGATPLFIAAQHGDTDVTKLLIKSGADLNLEKEVTDIHSHLHN